MENSPFPLGFVFKRYSWRAKDYFYEVIEEAKEELDNCYYRLILAHNDEVKCFTSLHKHQLEYFFDRGVCSLLDETEFREFERTHPNTLSRLKGKGISKFLRQTQESQVEARV